MSAQSPRWVKPGIHTSTGGSAAPDMTPRKNETPEAFRARLRARYAAASPEYREKRLARQRERRRLRYATDPVYREQLLRGQRERYETDPEYRQQAVERQRKRYARKMKGPS